MSHFGFNVSLGREVELYERVRLSDPTNAVLTMAVLAESGLETDAVLKDKDTFTAIVSGTTNWVTNTGYARIELDNTDLSAYSVDDDLNRILLTLPAQIFGPITAGDAWRKLVIGYDPDSTGGTDSAIIPITAQDILISGAAWTPSGNSLTVDLSAGWLYAS